MLVPCLRSFRMLLASDHLEHIHPRSTFELHCCESARICQLKIIHHSFYKKTQISKVDSLCRSCTLSANHVRFSLYVFLSTRIPAIIHVFGTQKVLKIPQGLPANYTIRHKFVCAAVIQIHNIQTTYFCRRFC